MDLFRFFLCFVFVSSLRVAICHFRQMCERSFYKIIFSSEKEKDISAHGDTLR